MGYWPVLGLVPGPGVELGVGLVVLGVSVPMPPALLPPDDAPPDMPGDELPSPLLPLAPDDEGSGYPAPPDIPDELPDEESGGMVDGDAPLGPAELPVLPDDDEPPLLAPPDSEGMPVEPRDEVPVLPVEPLLPELLPVPAPEPPPVMPVQALSSAAQAMGNIHLVIEHSR